MFALAWSVSAILGGVAIVLAVRIYEECANAMATLLRVLKQPQKAVEHVLVPGRRTGTRHGPYNGKFECEQPQGSSH
jgi:hypothetical protein